MLMFEEVCFLPETKKVNGSTLKTDSIGTRKKKPVSQNWDALGLFSGGIPLVSGNSVTLKNFPVENSGKILLRISHPIRRVEQKNTNTTVVDFTGGGQDLGENFRGRLTRSTRLLQTPEVKAGMISGRAGPWNRYQPPKTPFTSVSEVWLVMTGFGWGSFFPWLLIYKHFCFGRYLNGQINAIIPKLVNLNCVGRHFGKIPLVNPPFGVTNCRFLVSIICGKDVGGRLEREVSSGRHALPFSSAKRR